MKVAPSLLSADFSNLREELHLLEGTGADWLHLDVMDGQFVPNLTFGAPLISAIRPWSTLIFDTHLMIQEPHRYIQDFIKAGSQWITFHVEASSPVEETLKQIRSLGAYAGLSLKPHTPLEKIEPFLGILDLVLVMTVEPGFGGQTFMKESATKIKNLQKWRDLENRGNYLIEVDGGINYHTAEFCLGADCLVAGSYVFQGNYKDQIQNLKRLFIK